MGMGGFWAWRAGSAQPPKFIMLTYSGGARGSRSGSSGRASRSTPAESRSSRPTRMLEMKGDMSGGGAVIAAMMAIARLKPKINVTALVPATENMPGGQRDASRRRAARDERQDDRGHEHGRGGPPHPGRRAVLRAQRPSPIVDVATLTGAISVTLGNVAFRGVLEQRRAGGAIKQAGERRARSAVAAPDVGRLRGPEQEQHRRHEEQRRRGRARSRRRSSSRSSSTTGRGRTWISRG